MTNPFLARAESTAGNIIEFASGVDGAKSTLRAAAFVFASILAAMPSAAEAGAADDGLNWSSSTKSNDAFEVAVKKSISPFWDTRIGADMTVAREPTTTWDLLAEKAANGGNAPQSSAIAWAAATAPGAGFVWDKTVVSARFDAGEQSSKLGTSLIKWVPLRSHDSLALQFDCDVVQKGQVPFAGLFGQVMRNYEAHNSAKVTITGIGMSFVVGQTMSTTDDKWLRSVGAEQTLSSGITVSSAIGETAQGSTNLSVTAGFKKSW
ncbi:hypothetical protein ACNJX9_36170 [Bradyrhizobium sp. DASA03076]|uniref:hypothetical protein n=1 Tax=Bradyrhizobium sp. BLXBL-03 TaxID=3395916 RepID=UPI003F702400